MKFSWRRNFAPALAAAPKEAFTGPPIAQPKLWRSYPVDGISPEKLRRIERDADRGYTRELMELYDDVAKHPHVAREIRRAKFAIAGAELAVTPGDESDRGSEIARAARLFLGRIPRLAQMHTDLLDAEFRGVAAVWPRWEAARGAWWVVDWQAIDSRLFRLDADGRVLIETAEHLSGEPVPAGVILHTTGDMGPALTRGGFGRSILRPWLYAGFAVVDTSSFLERFGHPYVFAETPPNLQEGSPEIERVKAALRALVVDSSALVPPGVKIQFLSAIDKAGTVRDAFLAFVEWCEGAISKAVNGQTLTAQIGDKGSLAAARVHADEALLIVRARATRYAETLRTQLIAPWTEHHFGAGAPVPGLAFLVDPPEDAQARAQAEKTRAETLALVSGALRVPIAIRQVRQEFHLVKPEKGEAQVGEMAPRLSAHGVCPHCHSGIDLAVAQKKSQAVAWVT